MKHVYKFLFVALALTLISNTSFGIDFHLIELSIDRASGKLKDPGETKVHKGDWVVWVIKTGENIRFFHIPGAGHPFKYLTDFDKDVIYIVAEVDRSGTYDWKYNIIYNLKTDDPSVRRRIDPKIAVKPRTYTFIDIALILGFFTTCITSLIFFRKWRIAVAKQKNNSH